jgi:response regulator RpfG family c-di-GMP phosphodiesterase
MMLTGNGDIETAIGAINEGSVFRFLTKPCSDDVLRAALDAGLAQHRLIVAERDLLERTLNGCVRVLTEMLSLVNPQAFNRALHARKAAQHICRKLRLARTWHIDLAAMLSQLGCVAVPAEALNTGPRSAGAASEEEARVAMLPSITRDLLSDIPRLETVAAIVALQDDPLVLGDAECPLEDWDQVRLGGQILRVALDFDRAVASGAGRESALSHMRAQPGEYDARLVEALRDFEVPGMAFELQTIEYEELKEGMILHEDVCNRSGLLLVGKGQTVTPPMVLRLQVLKRVGAIDGRLRVLARRPDAARAIPA